MRVFDCSFRYDQEIQDHDSYEIPNKKVTKHKHELKHDTKTVPLVSRKQHTHIRPSRKQHTHISVRLRSLRDLRFIRHFQSEMY